MRTVKIAVASVLMTAALYGCSKGGEAPAPQAPPVTVATPLARQVVDWDEVTGRFEATRSVDVRARVGGYIQAIHFKDGDFVRQGQLLFTLDARPAQAALGSAQAQLAQAQREYDRFKILAERGVAPRVMAETAETSLKTAQAAMAASEARRGDRILRAPFAGVLGLTSVTPGTLISPGAVITTLDDASGVRVDFPMPERYLGVLPVGAPITATTDAFPGEEFNGRIALLDTRVNEQTRAVIARAEFPNPGNRIRPGMMMRVAVHQGRRQSLAVPEAAVQYEGQGAFVYRIARGETGTTAQRVEVQTGAVESGFVEIVSGLGNNDRIVASGLNRIQPGAPVTVEGAEGQQRGAPVKGGARAPQAARP